MFEFKKFVVVTLATLMVALPTTSCAPSGSDSADAFSDALENAGSGVPVLLPEEGTLIDIYRVNCRGDATCLADVELTASFYQREIDSNLGNGNWVLANTNETVAVLRSLRTFAERHGLVALVREIAERLIGAENGLSIASLLASGNGLALATVPQPKARQFAVVEALSKALATGRAADADAFIQATQTQFGTQYNPSILEDLRGWGAKFTTELQTLLDEIFAGSEVDADRAISSLVSAERADLGVPSVGVIKLVRKVKIVLIGFASLLTSLLGILWILQQVKKAAIDVKDTALDLVAGQQADAARATRIAEEVEGSGCQWRDLAAPMQLTETAAGTQLQGVAPISLKAGSVALIVDPRDYQVIGDQPACTVYCVYAEEDAELEGTTGGEALCAEFAALAPDDRYGWIDQHAKTANGGFFVEVFQLPDLASP